MPDSRRSVDRRRLRRRRTRLRRVAGAAATTVVDGRAIARRAELHRMGEALRRIVAPAPRQPRPRRGARGGGRRARAPCRPARRLPQPLAVRGLRRVAAGRAATRTRSSTTARCSVGPTRWRHRSSCGSTDDVMYGRATFGSAYEGPPGCVHGGYVAAAFDEVLGSAQSLAGRPGMTVRLTVNYRNPTPLHTELTFAGRVTQVDGRKTFTEGTAARRRPPVRRERGAVRGHRLHEGRGAAPPARGGVRHRRRRLTRQRVAVPVPPGPAAFGVRRSAAVVGQGAAELGEPARQRQPRPVARQAQLGAQLDHRQRRPAVQPEPGEHRGRARGR